MEKCPSCNENAVESDSHYTQEQLVCTSCGFVLEERSFAHEATKAGTTLVDEQSTNHLNFNSESVPNYIWHQNSKKVPKGKTAGLSRIKYLSSSLHIPSYITEEIVSLFSSLVKKTPPKLYRLLKKKALAGSCTYLILRRHDWPVMITQICNLLQCSSTDFTKTYNQVKEYTGIQVSTPDIKSLVIPLLTPIKLGNERDRITKLVINILEIASECWLISGKVPQPYILATTFLAWKSVAVERRLCTFSDFCKTVNVTQHHTTANRKLTELHNFLMKLAENMPWFKKDELKKKHLPYLLDSIIKHSKFLRSENISTNEETSSDVQEFQQYRSIRRFIRRSEDDNDSYVCPSDFTDSEINMYIRTDEQVMMIKKLTEKFKNDTA